MYEEYLQCNSHYQIDDKEDSDEISSDGEFNDALNLHIFSEDDSYINRIEGQMSKPFLLQSASKSKYGIQS